MFFCVCAAAPPNISQALQRHRVQAATVAARSLLAEGSHQSYATDFSLTEKIVGVKLVACWATDHQKSSYCHHIDVMRRMLQNKVWRKNCPTVLVLAPLQRFLN